MYILLKQAMRELFRERTRVILTILAIAWGTFTVATILAIGEGLRINFARTMANSGSNMLALSGVSSSKAYEGTPQNTTIRLTQEDLNSLKNSIPNIIKISPQYNFQKKIIYKKREDTVGIYGVNAGYEIIHQLPTEGRFISTQDVKDRRAVIVLGTEAKKQLFPDEDHPVGKQVWINRQPFQVIGVLKEKPQMMAEQTPDAFLNWIPYSTYELVANPTWMNSIVLTYQDPALLVPTKRQILKLIAINHHVDPNDENIVDFDDYANRQQKINNFFWGMEVFLGIIGTLTLVIAGVGIANVMLSTIQKATREIGIRMAVGAKACHIMLHYFLESLNVTLLGGMIGILCSYGIVRLIQLIPMKGDLIDAIGKPMPVLSWTVLWIVASVLGCIGFLSGLIPALRAARIDPAEALRYE